MAQTRFFLDTRSVKGENPAILKVAIAHNCKTTYISTTAKLQPNQWDEKRSKVVNHPDAFLLNTYISKVKGSIDNTIIYLANSEELPALSAIDVRERCLDVLKPARKQERLDKRLFLYRFEMYAETKKRGTRKTFEHTKERLKKFLGEEKLKKLTFEDITYNWLVDFDNFMAKTAPSINTRNIHYRNMRTVFNAAIDDNITSNYPFRRFKIKNVPTAPRDLTVEELRLLFFYKCEEHAQKYLDIFKLSFFLHGVNTVDISNLKDSDYSHGRLHFYRTKTQHLYSKYVEPEAMEIIQKYKGKDWLVNILDHWSEDEFFRRKMNKVLQKIGPVTIQGQGAKKHYDPLFPNITSYYARHSWASIASSIDIPDKIISEGLGHEYGNPITNIYIHFDNRKLDSANRKILDWVLYGKLDGVEVVKPGTPEFYGLNEKRAKELGLV